MFRWLSEFILKYRAPLLAITLLVALACMGTIPFLKFNFTPQQLFASTSNYDGLRDEFAEKFGREDNLVMVMVEGDDVLAASALTYVHQLTLRSEVLPQVRRALSVTTIEVPRREDDSLTTTPLLRAAMEADGKSWSEPGVEVSAAMAQQIRALAQSEPLLRQQLVSEDGTLTAVLLWLNDDIQDAADLEAVSQKIEGVIQGIPRPEGVSTKLGGLPRIRVEVVESLRREQIIFIPLTGLVYLLILIALFRRPSGALLPVATVGVAASMTVAMLVATGSAINIINNVLPTLIFIIGISDSVHMLTRQAEEIELGKPRIEATKAMIRHTGLACLLTSSTTAVGFISLLVADTDILKAFGWQAAAGVMFAYVATLLFIPTALSFMRPVRRLSPGKDGGADLSTLSPESLKDGPLLERYLIGVARVVLARPKTVIVIGTLLCAGFVFGASFVKIDTKLLEIYGEDHPTFQTTKLLERKLGGVLPVEISVEHRDRDHFKNPEPFAKLHSLQRFIEPREGFISTQSIVDFHQAARVALLGDVAQREVMPTSREQVEQLQLMIEGPPDARGGVRAFMTPDFRNARVLVRVEDFGARKMIKEGAALEAELARLFPPDMGYRTYIAGDAYVASVALDSFIRDLLYSLGLAMIIIFGMMTLVFRSIKMGLISVIPNVTPLLATLAYMGIAGIDLNTTTVIIFAISLGLAVDDTIHFLARFREEMDRHDDVHTALLFTYFGAGRAILLTSVLLVSGLTILLFSDFIPTTYFGKLTGITIFGAVFGDLFLLPPILLLVYREGTGASARRDARRAK